MENQQKEWHWSNFPRNLNSILLYLKFISCYDSILSEYKPPYTITFTSDRNRGKVYNYSLIFKLNNIYCNLQNVDKSEWESTMEPHDVLLIVKSGPKISFTTIGKGMKSNLRCNIFIYWLLNRISCAI